MAYILNGVYAEDLPPVLNIGGWYVTGEDRYEKCGQLGWIEVPPRPDHNPDTHIPPTWDSITEGWSENPKPLETVKTALKDKVTEKRWLIETGGVTLNGTQIRTDRDSQALISGAKALAESDPDELVDFKSANGWVSLDAPTMILIGKVVGRHVRACFRKERELHEAIDAAGDLDDLLAIDINAAWPNQPDPAPTPAPAPEPTPPTAEDATTDTPVDGASSTDAGA